MDSLSLNWSVWRVLCKKKKRMRRSKKMRKKNGVNLWWLNGSPSKLCRFNGYTSWGYNGIHFQKTTHTEKHVHSVYSVVFRGRHSWRNRNRRMKEGERRFSIPLYFLEMRWREKKPTGAEGWLHCTYPIGHPIIITQPTDQSLESYFGIGWRHPGDGVLQIEVRVSLYEPLESLGRLDWRHLVNKLEFKEKKTGRYHHFGVDEGRWRCLMSCLGVTGKPMVVTYLGQSGKPTDGLPGNMVVTWTTYYGKDFTRIVLELIGALEQRIGLV